MTGFRSSTAWGRRPTEGRLGSRRGKYLVDSVLWRTFVRVHVIRQMSTSGDTVIKGKRMKQADCCARANLCKWTLICCNQTTYQAHKPCLVQSSSYSSGLSQSSRFPSTRRSTWWSGRSTRTRQPWSATWRTWREPRLISLPHFPLDKVSRCCIEKDCSQPWKLIWNFKGRELLGLKLAVGGGNRPLLRFPSIDQQLDNYFKYSFFFNQTIISGQWWSM